MFFRRVVCLLAAAGLLFACSRSAPRLSSTQLNLYGFAQYVPATLIAGFETSTGVKVAYETYSSNEQMAAGLAANPGKYDLIVVSDYEVEILVDQRGLSPLDLALVPSYTNIDQRFLSPYFDPLPGQSRRPGATQQTKYKFTLPYQWGTTGIAYDQTKVSPPITSWADLWRPELAGKLVVLDDAREMIGMGLLALGYDKNETRPERIAQARDKLKTLMSGAVAIDSDAPEKRLLSGEAMAGVVYSGNAARAARENPNIVYVFPEDGTGIWFDNMAIPTGAPHPDAAHAFIEYVLQPENSVLITREFPYCNPNLAALELLKTQDAALYATYMGSAVTNPSPDVLLGARLVKRLRPDAAKLYDQYWAELKAGR